MHHSDANICYNHNNYGRHQKLTFCSYVYAFPSENHLARNMQVLQVFFLQDLQDLALNLASFALQMSLFLQELKNLALIWQEKTARQFSCKIRLKSCKKIMMIFTGLL